MSEVPPFGSVDQGTLPPPGPFVQQPPPASGGVWKWIVGVLALLVVTPCMCCGGCLAVASMFKEVTLSSGEHLGGGPMNVRFHYKFNGPDRGPSKSYTIVAEGAGGVRREQSMTGFAGRILSESDWTFRDPVDLGPENNKQPVRIWIEADAGQGRSTASNTITIYPKQ